MTPTLGNKITFITLRIFAAAGLLAFLWRAYTQFRVTPTLTLGLLVLVESATIAIYLTARAPSTQRVDVVSIVATGVATFYFLGVMLEPKPPIAALWFSGFLQCTGLAFQLSSKLVLGRSFGLLPDNKGVVTSGPYKLVRHPIYLGYLISNIGFLLASFSTYNLKMYSALLFFQCIRIVKEEELLKKDPTYRSFMATTKYRLIPGVW